MSLKRYVPWWVKIGAKVVLSRIAAQHGIWRRFNLFVHGAMDSPDYAYGVVRSHLTRLGWQDLREKTVLELGPGDSLFSAVIAKSLGARNVILVDAGAFAAEDVSGYRACCEYLSAQGLEPPDLSQCSSLADVLRECNAEYFTGGVEGLRRIPSRTVDFAFSQAVLEHVRLRDLRATLQELNRVSRPDGVASHQVDLKDHLGGALNNLRFSERVWESDMMANSGFYTNRVRYSEMLEMFTDAGSDIDVTAVTRWDRLPTARAKLAEHFRRLPDEDLLVSEFDVVSRPAERRAPA